VIDTETETETRALGLDVGDRRIGVAISDSTWLIAQGLDVLHRKGLESDVAGIRAHIQAHGITDIIVGWPLRLNGRPGMQARKVQIFANAIEAALGLPVHKWDERLSTVAAERILREGQVRGKKQRAVVDKVAATLILQGWLDARRVAAAQNETLV
jgi:putative Holliday junction resolvase